MKYRLALDLGSTSLGWAMIRLNTENEPCAVVKAGVRIFSDGRNPKDGSSLAVTRRAARAMRRRRDRLLKRKARMTGMLLKHGFFPKDEAERKALELLNPYELRAKGLNEALTPAEFARALFHINQRRGFKSNRKTDKKDNDSGALKQAIIGLRAQLNASGADGKARTVGELLWRRFQSGDGVRARYKEERIPREDGKSRIEKSYSLYIDRKMIEDEFDTLWAKQSSLNPAVFTQIARDDLKDALLHQRPLKPVKAGRCTLLPEEERAPIALPATQRARILQEVNHLRVLREGLQQEPLTLQQRNDLVSALEANPKRSFTQIKKLLGLGGNVQFNFEDPKRQELKGNVTSAILSKAELFGDDWLLFTETKQNEIVWQLVKEESESTLVRWLVENTGVDEVRAERIALTAMPEGYGSLSLKALQRIIPALREDVIPYSEAVVRAGFDHHSQLNPSASGEILPQLPYYGDPLRRFVAFGTGNPSDPPEKQFGKIANPTVHIGLNQVQAVVNTLIERYGHPSQVIVEVARELKQSKDQRDEAYKRQAENQRRNERIRKEIAAVSPVSEQRVRKADIEKWILWEELSFDVADRRCPYSGVQISARMLFSEAIEIEHILPFSQTLDDSLNNKTVALREANRIKKNRTPWDAREAFEQASWAYDDILLRAERMPRNKRYRFAHDGYAQWLKNDKDFLARALNDTRYMSRVAREYVSLICPQGTRVIPGQMTAMLRAKFGLNDILGLAGEKNRNDHRHHAVDACVIGVTDQGMMQRFAQASTSARERQLDKLVDNMPLPWPSYREHCARAVNTIWVSHKPDHGYEAEMFDQTIYNADGFSRSAAKVRSVIPFGARSGSPATLRHVDRKGQPKSYKGLLSNSNYCIEIVQEAGSWTGEVIATYQAYEKVRPFKNDKAAAFKALRNPLLALSGKPLVMRLCIDDVIRAEMEGILQTLRVLKINSSGSITFVKLNETNIPARYTAQLAARKLQADGKPFDTSALSDDFFQKAINASSLKQYKARRVTISPIGELRDPGFKE
jgi:CRISPR-associated endonuclease Csn1